MTAPSPRRPRANPPPALERQESVCGRAAVEWVAEALGAVDTDGVTVEWPCSVPLVQPGTLRRIIAVARATGAVVVEFQPPRPWWVGDEAAVGRPVGRVTAEASTQEPSRVPVSGVEALWLGDPHERAEAERALYARIAAGWQARGVVIDDPATTRIDATVRIDAGARIRPQTELTGYTVVGAGSRVGPVTTVRDSRIGVDCVVQYAVCQDVEIGDRANVGPYTWLRSGTRLGAGCRAGAYVELADSVVGDGTSVPHLAGLFSADVGRNCNFGSMSGPANFDGVNKNRTTIGDDVSIGSCTILVAPVSIGDGASTAAGTVITEDVPSGALGVARVPQRNVAGWAAMRRRSAA